MVNACNHFTILCEKGKESIHILCDRGMHLVTHAQMPTHRLRAVNHGLTMPILPEFFSKSLERNDFAVKFPWRWFVFVRSLAPLTKYGFYFNNWIKVDQDYQQHFSPTMNRVSWSLFAFASSSGLIRYMGIFTIDFNFSMAYMHVVCLWYGIVILI